MSSNTNLGNTAVNQGYVQLIHTGETGGLDTTLRTLYDGDGTAADLQIASDKVKVSTELFIGTKTLTEFIQDTVGTMLTTGNTLTNVTVTYDDANNNIDLNAAGEVTLTGSQTLTNKTFTSPVINTGISGTAILDEDNMASDSDSKLATQQSIKAYVDTEVAGLVSSAPTALDTLDELAAALGDDANFATTTATSLGEKLVKASNLSDLTNTTTARSNLGLGSLATASNISVSNFNDAALQTSSESFADNDTSVMTSAAIQDKIESFGYTTNTGDMTGVSITANDPLDVSQSNTTSGNYSATISLDATEFQGYLTDKTDNNLGADELLIIDSGDTTLKRKAINEIKLTTFDATGFSSGISFDGSTANGVLTFKDSDEATVESNLTFNGHTLTVSGDNANGINMAADGSNTANSERIFFTGTSTSAIFQQGNDLSFRTGATAGSSSGTERMVIDNSGNVGIGQASPSARLDVVGSGGTGIEVTGGSGYFAGYFGTDYDYVAKFESFDANGAIIIEDSNSTGNANRIQVVGDVMELVASNSKRIELSSGSVVINQDSDDVDFRVESNSNQNMLFVDGGNNRVGIGTGSPSSKLHISENGDSTDDAFEVSPDNGGNRTMTINGEKINVTTTNGGSAQQLVLNDNGGTISAGGHLLFGDNVRAKLGAGEDLQLGHDGNDSFISNYTGDYYINQFADDKDIILRCDDGGGGITPYITLDGSASSIEIAKKMQFPASHSADKIVMYSGGNEKIGTEANTLLFTGANHVFHDTSNNDMMKITSNGLHVDDILGLSNGTNRLVLDDDTRSGLANGVSLTGVNTVYICCDETNNGTGEIQFLKGTDNDLDAGTAVQMARIDNNSIFYIDDIYSMSNNNNRLILDDDTNSSQANGVSLTGANHVYICPDETNNNTGDVRIITGTDNDLDSGTATEIARIDNSGNAHFDADVVAFSSTVSDKRLKENITTIQNGLDKVLSLRGVEYDWNATSRKGEHDIGLIAQEVEKVIPEVVVEHDLCTGEFGLGKEKTFKTVDYEKIVGVLVEAIKELKQEIEDLK